LVLAFAFRVVFSTDQLGHFQQHSHIHCRFPRQEQSLVRAYTGGCSELQSTGFADLVSVDGNDASMGFFAVEIGQLLSLTPDFGYGFRRVQVAHAANPGESAAGLLSIPLFALLFCLFLRRTGNLWLGVGFHAGWDWGQTFFYGVPNSGLLP
jgi:hypothetical protein